MYILGINGGFRPGYQDVSACLIHNGKVVAAIEEERLNRVKYSGGKLPYRSVLEVLAIGNISIQDVDFVAFHGSTWELEIETKIHAYFINYFGFAPPLKRFHHHDCHAAGSFFSSGFDEALVLTMDNSGDGVSIQLCVGSHQQLQLIKRYERPLSFGVFYSLITQFCGFPKDRDEYKLMGLAAQGNKERFDFSWLLRFENGEVILDTDFIVKPLPKAPSLHADEMNFNALFLEKMGNIRRIPSAPISDYYKDVAASAQAQLEKVVLAFLAHYAAQTGQRKICLSGGVALNCLMNQKIMNADFVDEIFIQPSSSDAGISMGAAWLAGLEANITPVAPTDTFLGNAFTDEAIKKVLIGCNVHFREVSDPAFEAAQSIAANKVIGWFQQRMEFGPRALGNRSILANPQHAEMQAIVNQKIKFRESFRPFGASVLEEDVFQYFEGKSQKAPYMTLVYAVRPQARPLIPAVVHADNTCRIQTVNKKDNPLYYELLTHLKNRTGHGVVLNTSFNLAHEPIVNTPREAIASFMSSGMDELFIGHYQVSKKQTI